jgi:stearoyl-CoA desaturase (delta-9 desaturase)
MTMSVAVERPVSGISNKKAAEVLPTVANVIAKRNTLTTTEILQRGKYNWFELGWFSTTGLLGLLAFTQPFSLKFLPVMVGVYLWTGFSVTLYLHRHLTHRGFALNSVLSFVFALGSAVGFSGDPVGWVAHHRHHHKFSDTANDVHSPIYGWWHAHMAWFLRESREFDAEVRLLATDCRKVWYLRLLENRIAFGTPHFIVAGLIFAFYGLPGLLYGLYLPMLVMLHHTCAINSLTHYRWMGYRRFETDDNSVNSPWLLGALGEGWHNNHHNEARRVAHGLAWYEIDMTKYLIWTLEKLGLAKDVHWAK